MNNAGWQKDIGRWKVKREGRVRKAYFSWAINKIWIQLFLHVDVFNMYMNSIWLTKIFCFPNIDRKIWLYCAVCLCHYLFAVLSVIVGIKWKENQKRFYWIFMNNWKIIIEHIWRGRRRLSAPAFYFHIYTYIHICIWHVCEYTDNWYWIIKKNKRISKILVKYGE